MISDDFEIPEKDLMLKEEHRGDLRQTLGSVVEGDLPKEYRDRVPIICVGDVVTDTLLNQEIHPHLSIVDGKTRRGSFEKRKWEDKACVEIDNPQSYITQEAWQVIKKAIESDEKVTIYVNGEEDMLSLPCNILCPPDGIVLYGLPGKGMVINEVSKELKEKTWKIINKMIEVEGGR